MRIGLVSDIHCNIESLDMALAQMGDVQEVLCAGDLIFSFRFSNEVVSRLREIGARIVLGNHDMDVLGWLGDRVRSAPGVDQELLRWLAQQPMRLDTVVDGRRLAMFHSAPEPPYEYVYKEQPRINEFGALGADFVVYGHTHYAMEHHVNGTMIINPGSAGQPRDPRNGFRSSYAVLDTKAREAEFVVYDDPVHKPRE